MPLLLTAKQCSTTTEHIGSTPVTIGAATTSTSQEIQATAKEEKVVLVNL